MQGLVDPPRDGLTVDQVRWLLAHGPQVQVDQGCDLLDANNNVVADISADMVVGGEVTGDNTVTGESIAGKCQIKLMRELAWGRDRVRPWVSLSDGAVTAKFYQGVYVLTTPQQPSGETPVTYDVQGYDLTSILTDQVGDTYVVAAGTTYLTALRNVLTASGVGANLLLAGDAGSTALPYTMTWCLYDGGPSWLSICADLLESIGYNRLWADEVGNLRSEPKTATASAPVAWTFDATDTAAGIVSPGWNRDEDLWSAPNKWTFIRSNTNGVSPTVANGMVYEVTNQSDGPSSIDSLDGRIRHKTVYLDVPDNATLVARGNLAVAADKAAGTKINMQTFLPAAGHGDVVQFVSAENGAEKFPVQTWTTNLDGSSGSWVLGEWPTPSATPLAASAGATVTATSPLRVVVDGASVDSVANALDGAAYNVGDRVTVTVRNPVPPLIQGIETPVSGTGGSGGGGGEATVTVAAGRTTTGAVGTNAAVSNSGTDTNAVFDFTIPRGDTGAKGDAGPANSLAIGTVTQGTAAASITGTSPSQTLNLTLPKGDKGDQGNPGTAATVAVASTSTLAAGSAATVTNTGTSTTAALAFGIPKGDTGAPGPANTLAIGAVSQGAAAASITGTSPNQTLNLTIPKGDTGAPGTTATVAVASTTTLPAGSSATVTNTGTSSAATLAFGIPQGPKGDKGDPGSGSVSSVNGDPGPDVVLTAADVGAVPTARQVTAGTGLTGGGDLTLDRSLAVSYGTAAGTAAQGNDSRITGAAQKAANLSDLASAATALANLGGVPISRTINGHPLSANVTVTTGDIGAVPTSTTVNGHSLSGNVAVTASDLGLGNVTNTRVLTVPDGTAVPAGTPDGTLFVTYTQ